MIGPIGKRTRRTRPVGWIAVCPGGDRAMVRNQVGLRFGIGGLLMSLVGPSFGPGPTLHAEADILTASLRANPLFYADSQLIPYGSYSTQRTGGPLQSDINITYPLDVIHKRQARTIVARGAKPVLEAQYQDVVRLQIDNL